MTEIPDDKTTRHQFEAYLGHHLSFGNYLATYKKAFSVLFESVYHSGGHVDSLAYPILFIARHCMELGFKANIRYFIKYSDKEDFRKASTHNLENLFKGFKIHVNSTISNLESKHGISVDEDEVKAFNELCEKVERLTNIFHSLDKNSDSFRYPVNKDDNDSFKKTDTLNLLDLKILFENSMTLLTYTADVFANYTDYADAMEKMYEDEMRAYYGEIY